MRYPSALLSILCGAALLCLPSCHHNPPPSRWNLLWIVIDDLKADRLGAAGYERGITPNLDRLARSGVRFKWCATQAPWSLPSYASMLSSRYPAELVLGSAYLKHIKAETDVARSRDPARMPDMNLHWYVRLPDDVTMLAQTLKGSGFSTAGWVNNAWLSPGTYGMERGFDHYYDGVAHGKPYTPADETVKLAGDWIAKNTGGRWFAFVQLMDPHKPWAPHPEYGFGKRFMDQYDAEVKFTDKCVGTLLQRIEAMGLADRTVVVVNSDHGEGIFENDASFVGHGGGVIPEIVFVPLILKWPGGPDGRLVTALVRNMDVMPTVLALMRVEGPPEMEGHGLLEEIEDKAKTSRVPALTAGVLKGPEQISAVVQGERPDDLTQIIAIPAYEKADLFEHDEHGWHRAESTPDADRAATALHSYLDMEERVIGGSDRGLPPNLDEKTRASLKSLGYLQ